MLVFRNTDAARNPRTYTAGGGRSCVRMSLVCHGRTAQPMMRRYGPITLIAVAVACTGHAGTISPSTEAPPAMMIGAFVDDYGGRYTVLALEWLQLPRSRYRIVRWNVAEKYLIAQNDSGNRSAPRRWTRIDWMPFSGMPPYRWGFCYSVYDAPTAAAAESTVIVRRDTPRTGCNGFPFSRMARTPAR
jgi:hypothetical protein